MLIRVEPTAATRSREYVCLTLNPTLDHRGWVGHLPPLAEMP